VTDPKEKKPPTIRTRPPGKIGGGMFDRVKLRSEPHPIEEIIAGRGLQPPPDSETNPAGAPSETGITYPKGNTHIVGITSEQGTTEATGTTHPEGHTQSLGSTHSTGTTHSMGQTLEIGTTRRIGRTRVPRPSVRRAASTDTLPVSPERDFQKVPNSITREMATRLFRGKSKQLYDYLWSQSRGAITPSRTVRRSRPQLLRGAGFGSMGTVERCVDFLIEIGLLKVRSIVGEAGGNEYEVFTPEEVGPALLGLPPSTGTTYETGGTGSTLNQVLPVVPETGITGSTSSSNESEISGGPKTSFKTEEQKLDDEALAQFATAMKQAALDVTGKGLTPTDAQRWGELAEVLITELKIAAGRTTVSSVPAFLAEHLRRRLWKKDKRQLDGEEKSEADAPQPAAKVDASKCLDCFGTGMWYPEGFDKGVAKCRHEKLGKGD
jgi:hypothetical protein